MSVLVAPTPYLASLSLFNGDSAMEVGGLGKSAAKVLTGCAGAGVHE